MDPEKRKRLEAAGWECGDAADFLELTDVERQLVEVRLGLSRAVAFAESQGWVFVKAGKIAHCWGFLRCGLGQRDGCRIQIYSMPRSVENHAKDILRRIARCTH